MSLHLATRGSELALWQARTARQHLSGSRPGEQVELHEVRSSGDRDQATALARFGRIGIFTVEVDNAVLDGRAQVGVHSLKDMTTTLQDGIVLGAVLARGPVEDVLVCGESLHQTRLEELPAGSTVATGSLRRRAMIAACRPDLETVELRGNVGTRLEKLDEGQATALLMARAGFVRLGLDGRISQVLDTTSFLPAVGQGIVGLTCKDEDTETRELLAGINHRPSWLAALAERSVLRELRGGCNVPMGGHATLEGDVLTLRARVLSLDGRRAVSTTQSTTLTGGLEGDDGLAEALGLAAATALLEEGAGELVEEARQ